MTQLTDLRQLLDNTELEATRLAELVNEHRDKHRDFSLRYGAVSADIRKIKNQIVEAERSQCQTP